MISVKFAKTRLKKAGFSLLSLKNLIKNIGFNHLSGSRQPIEPAYTVDDKYFSKH